VSNPKKPRKLPKAERVRQALHQRVQYERSQAQAVAREVYLQSLMRHVFSDRTNIRDEP
jgi:hypothetical protein